MSPCYRKESKGFLLPLRYNKRIKTIKVNNYLVVNPITTQTLYFCCNQYTSP